jgi:hypothetical protein
MSEPSPGSRGRSPLQLAWDAGHGDGSQAPRGPELHKCEGSDDAPACLALRIIARAARPSCFPPTPGLETVGSHKPFICHLSSGVRPGSGLSSRMMMKFASIHPSSCGFVRN